MNENIADLIIGYKEFKDIHFKDFDTYNEMAGAWDGSKKYRN